MNKEIRMFKITFNNLKISEVLSHIDNSIELERKLFIVTPNVDHIVRLSKDTKFQQAYNKANMVLADGMPVLWASRILGKPLVEKVSGADLVPNLFKKSYEKKYRVFILGSEKGVANSLVNNIRESKDSFPITCYSPEFGFEKIEEENIKIINLINDFKPDILLVSLGAPKGEKWIYNYIDNLEVKVVAQVGAAIDFVAGSKRRAPKWMQKSGLEWFYRFIQEPKRLFKRYFVDDSIFLLILIKEYFNQKKGNLDRN